MMSRELRKMKKEVTKYIYLMYYRSDILRKNPKPYLEAVTIMQEYLDSLIDTESELLSIWCSASSEIWSLPSDNFILRLKRNFFIWYANHFISHYSYEISVAGILQSSLDDVRIRLNQFDKLLSSR